MSGAALVDAGLLPYGKALELQRSLHAAVVEGAAPETVILVEHPPVVTTGRRTEEETELHIPGDAAVELVETDRGGKSTYHAPGQLVCYPILDLTKHGKDVRRYVRDLERAIVDDARGLRARGDHDRRADRRLDAGRRRAWPAEDRVDRRPGGTLGDDARLRPQCRPRPGPVHRVDHGLRARRRRVHDDGPRARTAADGRGGEAGRGGGARRRLRSSARGRGGRRRPALGARQAGTTSGLSVHAR